jgi:periplasmic protein CpxP/Spy
MTSWIKRSLYGLLGATVALGLTACGHHRHEGGGWQMNAQDAGQFREHMIERVSSRLDLNQDQRRRLGVLFDKVHEQRTAFGGPGGDPRVQLQSLVSGDKFDRARAQALVAEKTGAVNAKSPEVIAALGDFYDSLNPAQQAKVRDFMQRRHRGWWRHG